MLRFDRDGTARIGRFYAAAWRWHFHAGICVLPFVLVLALSGLAMLASEPLDRQLNTALHTITPGGAPMPAAALANAVTAARPDDVLATFVPPRSAAASAQFSVTPRHSAAPHGAHGESESTAVFVDPYSAAILGELDPDATLYAFAKRIHGTLLLGNVGDYLIEIVAGFGVLLLATELSVAWWLRRPAGARRLVPPPLPREPKVWRAAVALMLVVSLAFPLAAATIAAALALDLLLLSRLPRLKHLFE